jgi:hypothetical protein
VQAKYDTGLVFAAVSGRMWTTVASEVATTDGFSFRDLGGYECKRSPEGESPRYSDDADKCSSLPSVSDEEGEPHGPCKEHMGQEPGTTKGEPTDNELGEERVTWDFAVKITGGNKEWEENIGRKGSDGKYQESESTNTSGLFPELIDLIACEIGILFEE